MNLLAILIIAAGFCDGISFILAKKQQSNLVFINSYFIIQFILVLLIYYHIYLKKRGAYPALLIAIAMVMLILNTVFWQSINTIQNLNWIITSLVIIAVTFGHILYLKKFPVYNEERSGPYWISTGLLFYCCFSFGIFVLSKFFIENLKLNTDFKFVWMFHNLNNIFKNACFFIAIWWATHRDPTWDKPQQQEDK